MSGNRFAALALQGLDATRQEDPAEQGRPAPTPPAPVQPQAGPPRMLGGRVPDALFKEFQRAKMDAESATGIRRVTTEDAVAAFVRMLRDPEAVEKWHAELIEVRQGR